MPGGSHVTAEMCADMRRRARKGYFRDIIATRHDVSVATVQYHASGKCAHDVSEDPVSAE